jgi:drug/metabolite transporter (DMT)-like permease
MRTSVLRTQSLWMIGASIAFSGMSAAIKLAAGAGVPVGHIVFYRGAFSVLAMASYLKYRGKPLRTSHWRIHLRRAVAGYVGLIAYVVALTLLPLATVVSLNYTSPLILAAMLLFIHRERPETFLLAALLGGICGVALILRPTFDQSQWFGGLIAFASAALAAWTALNIRALGKLKEDPARTVLYFSLFITVATLPWFMLGNPGKMTARGWLAVLAAATCAVIGQIMLTLAYQRGHTLLVSMLGYSQVVFTSVLGLLVWRDELSLLSWLGMALVIFSGAIATTFARPPGANGPTATPGAPTAAIKLGENPQ